MKDNKLERFFNAIDFNKDYEEYFTNAKVMDVRLNKELNRMTLLINLDTEVPINVFNELCVKGLNLDGASSVRYKFTINGIPISMNACCQVIGESVPPKLIELICRKILTIENFNNESK